jgi:hypothetical protein
MGRVIRQQTAVEYFRELVEDALKRRQVNPHQLTAFYLVRLLAGFAGEERPSGGGRLNQREPLGVRLVRALQSAGQPRREGLREVGDASLFVAGFFADSLNRQLVDVDYYAAIGGYAYAALSRADTGALAPVFAELADKFVPFIDVLAEVSDHTAMSRGDADLLRLYEKWLRTGSRRDGEVLARRGIAPNASIGRRFVQ